MRHRYQRDRAISNHHKRRFLAVSGVAGPYLSENHSYRVLLKILTKDECKATIFSYSVFEKRRDVFSPPTERSDIRTTHTAGIAASSVIPLSVV